LFNKKITTICFEGNEIRTLTVRGNKVVGWQTRSLAPEDMSLGTVHTPKAAAKVIKSSLLDLRATKRNLISAVPGSRSVHRIIRVPVIPEKMLAETIERKARQEFAIPIEDTDLSWQVITQQDNHLIIYVLAVPKLIIDQQVASLKEAGIRPKVMDIKPLALCRIAGPETAIIVNLEEHSMDVIIRVNHVPVLVRSIPLDTGDLTGEAKTDLLSQELARTTKYYNESNRNNRLPEETPVHVSGALFSNTAIDSRLEDAPSLVERLRSRTSYPLKPPTTELELPPKFPLLKYATNLGLAVKE
jgi:Tfp pilus assembly PilM family ATPase